MDNYTDWIENNPYAIDENTGTPPARCFCDVNQENCEAELEIEYVVNNMSRTGPMTNVWDRVSKECVCHWISTYIIGTSVYIPKLPYLIHVSTICLHLSPHIPLFPQGLPYSTGGQLRWYSYYQWCDWHCCRCGRGKHLPH